MAPTRVVCGVGSGRNGRRIKLVALLGDASVGTMVVEDRGRLARFGVEVLAAAVAATSRRLVVVDCAEVIDDAAGDRVGVVTGLGACAGLCGCRCVKCRAHSAVAAAGKAAP